MRVFFRAAAATVAVGVAVVAGATVAPGVASAHVTVSSAGAVQGGYAKITFRVPNEKANAGTAKLEVVLPTDKPVVSVSTKPVNGWTAATEKTKLATPVKTDDGEITEAVSKITWTAAPDAVIQPGQFQEFDVSLGPLPEADQMVFKALQTYSDGDIVRWIDEPGGATEAEHPAPVLKLTKAAAAQDAHGGAGSTDAPTTASAANRTGEAGRDGLTLSLAVAGVLIAVAGLVVALLAYRKVAAAPPAA
jgi:periplasmic copper chaperone A